MKAALAMMTTDTKPKLAMEECYIGSEKVKKLTKEQSIKEYEKLKKDLFNIRFQKINGQVKDPSKINETKRNIARLKTLIERKNA